MLKLMPVALFPTNPTDSTFDSYPDRGFPRLIDLRKQLPIPTETVKGSLLREIIETCSETVPEELIVQN